jgi:uncharacterized protein YkwD
MRLAASLAAVLTLSLIAVAAVPRGARAASPHLDRAERGVVHAINHQRARYGLGAVRVSARLNRAADFHSSEMAYGNYFAHPSLNGTPMANRVRRFAHRNHVGETLAMLGGHCGRHMGGRVVGMWMNSAQHRTVMLSGGFRRIGVARRGGHGACMVTADFASRR